MFGVKRTMAGSGTLLGDRLGKCYSGAVYDTLRERGIFNSVLPRDIRPIDDSLVRAGPVFPVKSSPKPGLEDDASLMSWTGFLSVAPRNHVVVADGGTESLALMGELSAETLQGGGVKGYVTNGGCHDCAFIRSIGFPVFSRFFTPRDVVGAWSVDALDTPVTIGDVKVSRGDYLIADIDGVVIIPADMAEEGVTAVENVMQTEDRVRAAIRNGSSPKEAYLRFGRF